MAVLHSTDSHFSGLLNPIISLRHVLVTFGESLRHVVTRERNVTLRSQSMFSLTRLRRMNFGILPYSTIMSSFVCAVEITLLFACIFPFFFSISIVTTMPIPLVVIGFTSVTRSMRNAGNDTLSHNRAIGCTHAKMDASFAISLKR